MKKIQAEIAIINLKTPIYDDMLIEVFLGALKEEPYSSIIFRFNNEILRPKINTILRQLKEKEFEEASKNLTKSKNNRAIGLFFQCSQEYLDKHVIVDGCLQVNNSYFGLDFLHSCIRLLSCLLGSLLVINECSELCTVECILFRLLRFM